MATTPNRFHITTAHPNSQIDSSDAFTSETISYRSLKSTKLSTKSTNSSKKPLCNTRTKVTAFIIVGFLLISAVVSAAVIFTVIKPNSSSSFTNSNQDLALLSTQFPASTIITGSQSGSPCSPSTYTSINDPSRNYNSTGSHGSCDNGYPFVTNGSGAWIRFEGSGGTKIPTWSIDINHCGAYLSVWSNSTLPATVNIMTNITFCSNTMALICPWVIRASVIYCPGNYYVYFLPSLPMCKARYCTA